MVGETVTPGLLVSVRSAAEAEAALAGGATLIDVKEPARGSLGFAGWDTIGDGVRAVGGRAPVSAALGELVEWDEKTAGVPPHHTPLTFVKWGLAWGNYFNWREKLLKVRRGRDGAVAVAYADWFRASAPPPAEVVEFAVAE